MLRYRFGIPIVPSFLHEESEQARAGEALVEASEESRGSEQTEAAPQTVSAGSRAGEEAARELTSTPQRD